MTFKHLAKKGINYVFKIILDRNVIHKIPLHVFNHSTNGVPFKNPRNKNNNTFGYRSEACGFQIQEV